MKVQGDIGNLSQSIYKEAWDAGWDQAVSSSIPFNYALTQDMADAFKKSYQGDMGDFPAFWDAWQKSWMIGSQLAAQRCADLMEDGEVKKMIQDEFGLEKS